VLAALRRLLPVALVLVIMLAVRVMVHVDMIMPWLRLLVDLGVNGCCWRL
jgi:hypothetical protein